MTYSVLDVGALAHDLIRLPEGLQVAQVLRTALACDASDVAALSARHPGPHRLHRWGQVLAAGPHGPGPGPQADPGTSAGTGTAIARRFRRRTAGDLDAVDRMLRHDVLDWTWLGSGDLCVQDPEGSRACDVLADAAGAAYCSDRLDESTRRSMAAPFLAARVTVSSGTGHEVLDAALTHLAATDERGRDRWRRAADGVRPVPWTASMHEASWALSLSGRQRLAADAQLSAVAAFAAAGFTSRDAARGVWDAVSGSVQALLCADLLPAAEADVLLAGWRTVNDPGRSTGPGR